MSDYPSCDLSRLNTLAVPAQADHFVAASSVEEIRQACAWAQQRQLPVWVLGEGSNVLAAERVEGLVVQPAIRGIATLEDTANHAILKIGAGENWHNLVCHTLEQQLFGLENLALIPGSVGAAPVQNIGAYGVELSHVFHSLHAVEVATGRERHFSHADCGFGYRDSVFKNRLRDRYIITHVSLKLSRQAVINLSYPALTAALAEHTAVTPADVAQTVCRIRQQKLPDPAVLPNCGSFFKNPVVDASGFRTLQARYPELVAFAQDDGSFKLAAAWLIDRAGWKGKSCQGIRVHEQQALVLTNPAQLPVRQVLAAAAAIQSDVVAQFGVELEMEPQPLGRLCTSSGSTCRKVH